MTRDEKAELIQELKDTSEIYEMNNGTWCFYADGTQFFSSDQLRAIADELDRLNAKEQA